MAFRQWDPQQVYVTFKGVAILGFMDGTFIKAERNEDAFSMQVGAGGDVTRVRSRNRTGVVTITLQAASPSNDTLSGFAADDEFDGSGYGALLVKDANVPSTEFAVEASGREWSIECAELLMKIGGSDIQ